MDSVDAMRTTAALVVGVVAAVVFSGYLPLSGSLAVGVLAYALVRRGFGTVEYGPHGLLALFAIVSAAAALRGIPPAAPVAEAAAVVLVSVLLLFVYETLLRVGVAADAGGFEAASIGNWWAVPGAVVGIFVTINERLGTKGYEALLLAGFGTGFVLLHVLFTAAELGAVITAPVTFAAAACLGGAMLAWTPRSQFDDSLRGSLFLGATAPFRRFYGTIVATRDHNRSQDRSPTAKQTATADGGSVADGASFVDTIRAAISPSVGDNEGDGAASAESSSGGREHDDPSPWPSEEDSAAVVDDAAGSTTSNGDDQQTAGSEPETPEYCENCGSDGPNVRLRAIIPKAPGLAGKKQIALCAPCQYARGGGDPAQCRTGIPVDRASVLAAADHQCQTCGAPDDLELHAVVPMDGKGHPHEHNVVALCGDCHADAHD